jgi:mono/diheme cytochrome c family protein
MNKMIPVLVALLVLIAVPLGVTADEAAPAVEQVDMEAAKVTFETTCSQCHKLQRPLAASKGQVSWEKTVNRMSGYHKQRFRTHIPEEDQKAIVQYLLVNAGK